MKKFSVVFSLLLCAVCLFGACSEDDGVNNPFEGSDNNLVAFALKVKGVSYDAAIVGNKITVSVPVALDLTGAEVNYKLCEHATILPDPKTVTTWNNEQVFRVKSYNGASQDYTYVVARTEISHTGNVQLLTQADVDAFAATGSTVIDGNLIIGADALPDPATAIVNLDGLRTLKQVSYRIIINRSYNGVNFDGLSQLEKCGGLYVGSVTSPITFPAKEGVTVNLPAFKMSGEVVLNSPSLKSISCAKLESTGALFIASDALTELNMTALKEVAGDLSVQNSPNAANSVLTELSFPQLTSIGGALTMHYFSGLTKLNLTKLNYLGGGMDIALNASLLEEVNFPELVVANGVVSIERAPGLKKIALPKVKKITSFIFNKSSYGSYPLIKLDLSSLEEIADELYIRGIPMERLSLPKLTTVGGDCTLWDLQSVTNIEIPALTKMAGKLYFYSLNMLVTLDLSKLTELGSVELVGCLKLAKIKSPKVITSIELNLASNATCPVTEFEGLERVTGEMSLSNASGTSLVSIPHVKHIGQFSLNYTGKNAILTLPDVQTMETLDVSASDLVELTAPKLTAVTTKFKLSYCSALLTINIPELRTVGDFILMEHNAWSTNKARMTHINAFNGITSAKSVDISYCGKLVDFSGLSAVVSALATDKWSVSNCAYNPTLQDMRDGHYVKQ